MKRVLFIMLCCAFVVMQTAAQENTEKKLQKLPATNLKTLDGKTVSTSDFTNDGKPYILSFWATWCKPCVTEFTTIADVYDDWQEETGVKLIAISIDDARTTAGVKPMINGKDWPYEFYLDANSDFKRAMNVNLIPHTFIINSNNEIVWQHASFSQGAEIGLIEVVRKIIDGRPVE